jgi:hypothetical protein
MVKFLHIDRLKIRIFVLSKPWINIYLPPNRVYMSHVERFIDESHLCTIRGHQLKKKTCITPVSHWSKQKSFPSTCYNSCTHLSFLLLSNSSYVLVGLGYSWPGLSLNLAQGGQRTFAFTLQNNHPNTLHESLLLISFHPSFLHNQTIPNQASW